MKEQPKVRFVREVETKDNQMSVRKPFRVEKDNQRRFVRLEISSPITLKKVRDSLGNFWASGDWHQIHGRILNISAGGVLVELDQTLSEGDVVVMQFTVQDVEYLSDVLGIVKRADLDEGFCLAGIQFIDREFLKDVLSRAQLEVMAPQFDSFDDGIRSLLNRYMYLDQLEGKARGRTTKK